MVRKRKPRVLVVFGMRPLTTGNVEVELTKIFPSQLPSLKRDKRIKITRIVKRF